MIDVKAKCKGDPNRQKGCQGTSRRDEPVFAFPGRPDIKEKRIGKIEQGQDDDPFSDGYRVIREILLHNPVIDQEFQKGMRKDNQNNGCSDQ